MLARVPGSRTTKDVDLASQQAPDLAEAERALADLVAVDYDTQIDTVTVDVVVGPSPVGRPEVVEPANRLHLRRPLITHPYRLYPTPATRAANAAAESRTWSTSSYSPTPRPST